VPVTAAPDLPTLLFALAASFVTAMLFGIAPAWVRSRADPTGAVRVSLQSTPRTRTAQSALVILQATASVVLVSVATMLGQSLRHLEQRSLGFAVDGRYLVSIDSRISNYTEAQLLPLMREIETGLGGIPGVRAASAALYAPMAGLNWSHSVRIAGRPEPGARDDLRSGWTRVTPAFFDTLENRMVLGRSLTNADTAGARRVAVVNEAFARKFFPHENPLGQHFGPAPAKYAGTYEIVGVAADLQYFPSTASDPLRPMYFLPEAQSVRFEEPELLSREIWSHYPYNLVVWAPGNPSRLVADIRDTLKRIAPDLVVRRIDSYRDVVVGQYAQQNMIVSLSWLFGAIGVVLAAVGLYGLTAYRVEQQRREIGVRMALGANRASVMARVLRTAGSQVGLGVMLGVPAAIAANLLLANQLFGAPRWDSMMLIVPVILLTIATLVAAAIPARRAASVDPLRAVRAE
jgi:predicted permease